MSNSNSILLKARKQAVQLARDVAKSGSKELLEIPKRAPGDLVGGPYRPSPIVEAMKQSNETSGATVSGLKHVEDINTEMARLREMRLEEVEKARKPQVTKDEPKLSVPGKPLLPSSPRRGPKIHFTEKQSKIEAKPGKD